MTTTVELHGLAKRFGSVQALRGVDLRLAPGITGLLGPNGAGKTTLLRILATVLPADAGTLSVLGEDPTRADGRLAVRRQLGYLPQEFGVYPKLSALDMLDHLAVMKGITHRGERKDVVEGLLRQTNLYDVRKKKLGTYSGGMKQRFGIAQALLGDPKLIIVDEPTAGLDPEERTRFLGLLSEIGDDVVVVLSTHIVDDVSDVCQGMAILLNGELRCQGEPRAILETLQGTIWRKAVTREELAAYRQMHAVLGTRWQAGRLVVHILGANRPDDGFEAVPPDLRDLYFHTLSGPAGTA